MNAGAEPTVLPVLRSRASPATFAYAALVAFALLIAIPLLPGAGAATVQLNSPAGGHLAASAATPVHLTGLPVVNGFYAGTHVPVGAIPSSALHLPSTAHVASASPVRLGGTSTSSNFFVNGSDCQGWGQISTSFQFPIGFSGESVTSVGGSNTTLVAAGGSLIGAYNGTGGNYCNTISVSPAFEESGATGVWRSTDGGHTWPSSTFLSINQTHWTNTADASNGSIHWGSPSVASGPSNTVLVGDVYVNGCYFATGCSNATGIQADWGISVDRSTNGGVSFGDPVQVYAAQGLKWFDMGACAAPFGSGFYYYNVPEQPHLAINPSTGLDVLTFDVYHATVSSATCSVQGNAQVLVSTSSDGGKTWSTPKGISGDLSELSTINIGPAPGYNLTSTFLDFQNATTSSISLEMTRSTNNGGTWTTP
ncbi:MAG TPA: hypothetical protein VEY07_05125, partial [Thermoplasmata archaeon]|nr:hypothetical protein [Thermoplasmata archaeon]